MPPIILTNMNNDIHKKADLQTRQQGKDVNTSTQPKHPPRLPKNSTLHTALQSALPTLRKTIPKTDRHRNYKSKTKHARPPFVMIADGDAVLDLVDAP